MAVVILLSCLGLGFGTCIHSGTADHSSDMLRPAVYWENDGARVFLVQGSKDDLELTVLSDSLLQVVARTERNSREPVQRRLTPLEGTAPGVFRYRFRHRFSRTSIWLALDFYRDGEKLEALTRCFYGGIHAEASPGGCGGAEEEKGDPALEKVNK